MAGILNGFHCVSVSCKVVALLILINSALCTLTNVDFAFVHTPVSDVDMTQLYVGLKAAELAINSGRHVVLPPGLQIRFQLVIGAASASDIATGVSVATSVVTGGAYFGAILPDAVNTKFLMDAVAASSGGGGGGGSFPLIAPRTSSLSVYATNASFVLNIRPPPTAQLSMMFHHALHPEDMRCSSWIAFLRSDVDGLHDIIAALHDGASGLGRPVPRVLIIPAADAFNASAAADYWYGDGTAVAGCSFNFMLPDDIEELVIAVATDARFRPFSYYHFAPSLFTETLYTTPGNPGLNLSEVFGTLHVIEFVPNPEDPRIAVSAACRDDLAAWIATSPTLPATFSGQIIDTVANYFTMEGYLSALMVARLVERTPQLTVPSQLIETAYQLRYLFINQTVLGPFNNGCVSGTGVTGLPCFCNVGGRVQSVANGMHGGRIQFDDFPATGYSWESADLTVCSSSVADLAYPVGFFIEAPRNASSIPSYPAAETEFVMAIARGLKAASDVVSSTTRVFGKFNAVLHEYYDPVTYPTMADFMLALQARFDPYILVGGVFARQRSPGPTVLMRTSSEPQLEHDLSSQIVASRFAHYTLELDAALADLVHSVAAYAADVHGATAVYARQGVTTRVAADSAALMSLAQRSLNTFQFPTSGDRSDIVSTADIDAVLDWAFAAAAHQPVVLMLALQEASHSFPTLAHAVVFGYSVRAAAASPAVLAQLLVLAPWSHSVWSNVQSAAVMPAGSQLVFATPLPAFWSPSSSLGLKIATAVGGNLGSSNDLRVIDAIALVSMIAAVTAGFSRGQGGAEDLLRVLYTGKVIADGDVSYGPLVSVSCSDVDLASQVAGRCQCYRMRQLLHVHNLRDWQTNASVSSTEDFYHTLAACGPVYGPLLHPAEASTNVALAAGVAGGVGGAVLVAAVAASIVVLGRGRSNRNAPKDPQAPFAMVFTDIQSSTTLWARAPAEMALSVDQHHEMIRSLIATRNGYEVKTIGDSFMVAFKRASDAMALALDIQTTFFNASWPPAIDDVYKSLEDGSLPAATSSPGVAAPPYGARWNGIRVRVGLHWGVGNVKLDPVSQGYDYYGTVVNTAARVEGVGHGGQVLCTKDFMDALESGGTFPFSEVVVLPLGPQPLRGLDAPLPLFQFLPASLQDRQFGPLRLDVDVAVDADGVPMDSPHPSEAGCSPKLMERGTPFCFEAQHGGGVESVVLKLLRGPNEKLVPSAVLCSEVMGSVFAQAPEPWRQAALQRLAREWRTEHRADAPEASVATVVSRALLHVLQHKPEIPLVGV